MANILVCEDDRLISLIIKEILTAEQYQVKFVRDGALAIQALQEDAFELVISDIIMPVRSGLEVIDFLRNELKSDVPVLIMSGRSESEFIREARETGASDFLSKPFEVEIFKRKVLHLLQLQERINSRSQCESGYQAVRKFAS